MSRPGSVDRLIASLARLPGVGPKTSERLAYHLLSVPLAEAAELAEALLAARRATRVCAQCFNLDETEPCRICADPARDHARVLVVEDARDVASFEDAGWRGLYHVLQGRVSQLEGTALADLTSTALVARARAGGIQEVCLALNPDLEGEGTAQLVAELLRGEAVAVTRIARGIPAGASITQVGKSILADAVAGRRPL